MDAGDAAAGARGPGRDHLRGKREIGQFTLFDLALVLLAANALQPAITGPDASIPGGLIVVLTIFILNQGVAVLRVRSPRVRRLLEFGPTVIGRDGAWLLPALVRQGLDLVDVEAALREQGETLATPYDDAHIARKTRALAKSGIPILRIKLEPEEIIVN